MRSRTRQTQKDAVVAAYMEGGDLEEAAGAAMCTPDLVRYWVHSDPEFRQKAAEAKEHARLRAEGLVDGHLPPLVQRLVEILQSTPDEELAVEGIIKVLKGRGVLVDRQQTEVKGVIAVGSADDWFRAYREARREFSEVGGKSLGVPGGDGQGQRPAAGPGGDTVPAMAPSATPPAARRG